MYVLGVCCIQLWISNSPEKYRQPALSVKICNFSAVKICNLEIPIKGKTRRLSQNLVQYIVKTALAIINVQDSSLKSNAR